VKDATPPVFFAQSLATVALGVAQTNPFSDIPSATSAVSDSGLQAKSIWVGLNLLRAIYLYDIIAPPL
jgi:hypothetical protein